GRFRSRRLVVEGLESAPVADNLIEALLPPVVLPGPVLFDGLLPRRRRLSVLPAILVLLSQRIARLLSPRGFAAVGDALVNSDPVELVRHGEALDAAGEARDRLVVLERVQGKRAAFVLFRVVLAALPPAVMGHRLHAALRAAEVGEDHIYFACPVGREFDGLAEHPARALAVVDRLLVASRHFVVDRLAVGIDRRAALLPAAIVVTFLVIGKLAE